MSNAIGASIVIKGNISSAEDLAVTGSVEGDIRLDKGQLTLAAGSRVVGDIVVPSVIVQGHVRGHVTATERVDVRSGACVTGSIAAPTLVVADGAEMTCRVEMPLVTGPRPAWGNVSGKPQVPA